MSGIYISNMDMPAKGYRLLLVHADGAVESTIGETTAIPIQDHGRLIDADAVAKMVLESVNQEDAQGFMFTKIICQIMKDAPTIICADKKEGGE